MRRGVRAVHALIELNLLEFHWVLKALPLPYLLPWTDKLRKIQQTVAETVTEGGQLTCRHTLFMRHCYHGYNS